MFDFLMFVQYRLLKMLYECFYYYFMPFAVVFLTFLIQEPTPAQSPQGLEPFQNATGNATTDFNSTSG